MSTSSKKKFALPAAAAFASVLMVGCAEETPVHPTISTEAKAAAAGRANFFFELVDMMFSIRFDGSLLVLPP